MERQWGQNARREPVLIHFSLEIQSKFRRLAGRGISDFGQPGARAEIAVGGLVRVWRRAAKNERIFEPSHSLRLAGTLFPGREQRAVKAEGNEGAREMRYNSYF